MTPEREAEIRGRLKHSEYDWYTEPLVEDLLAALDAERAAVIHLKRELVAARAERDELRQRLATIRELTGDAPDISPVRIMVTVNDEIVPDKGPL